MTRLIPIDAEGVKTIMTPNATEFDIQQKAPSSQSGALRAVKTLMDMAVELEGEIAITPDPTEKAELEQELADTKAKLQEFGVAA